MSECFSVASVPSVAPPRVHCGHDHADVIGDAAGRLGAQDGARHAGQRHVVVLELVRHVELALQLVDRPALVRLDGTKHGVHLRHGGVGRRAVDLRRKGGKHGDEHDGEGATRGGDEDSARAAAGEQLCASRAGSGGGVSEPGASIFEVAPDGGACRPRARREDVPHPVGDGGADARIQAHRARCCTDKHGRTDDRGAPGEGAGGGVSHGGGGNDGARGAHAADEDGREDDHDDRQHADDGALPRQRCALRSRGDHLGVPVELRHLLLQIRLPLGLPGLRVVGSAGRAIGAQRLGVELAFGALWLGGTRDFGLLVGLGLGRHAELLAHLLELRALGLS